MWSNSWAVSTIGKTELVKKAKKVKDAGSASSSYVKFILIWFLYPSDAAWWTTSANRKWEQRRYLTIIETWVTIYVDVTQVLRNTEQAYSQRYRTLRSVNLSNAGSRSIMDARVAMEPWEKKRLFRETMKRFASQYFLSFPEYPCSYCGVLSPLRTTVWIEFSEVDAETGNYGLSRCLGVQLVLNGKGEIAVCSICYKRKKAREAPDIGRWPQVLLHVPQYSRSYLSFVKLNCNLGRTQSHSGQNWHNPYSTYRTLRGNQEKSCMVANE